MKQPAPRSVPELLHAMSAFFVDTLRSHGKQFCLDPETTHAYRGNDWTRTGLLPRMVDPWKNNGVLKVEKMAIEVITVAVDLTHECHFHAKSHAVVTILGEVHGFHHPTDCRYCLGTTKWRPVKVGEVLNIPPGTVHGFTSGLGLPALSFLSVQSKRIDEDFTTRPVISEVVQRRNIGGLSPREMYDLTCGFGRR